MITSAEASLSLSRSLTVGKYFKNGHPKFTAQLSQWKLLVKMREKR